MTILFFVSNVFRLFSFWLFVFVADTFPGLNVQDFQVTAPFTFMRKAWNGTEFVPSGLNDLVQSDKLNQYCIYETTLYRNSD